MKAPFSVTFSLVFPLAFSFCLLLLPASTFAQDQAGSGNARLKIDHLFEIGAVSEPQVSPDGEWIAFTVTRDDLEADESRSRVWMTPAAEGEPVPLTSAKESSSKPRWSPDGRFLAFLSGRDDKPAQVWALFLGGGEARQLTDTAQPVRSFEWSPDSSRLLLELQDPSPQQLEARELGDQYEEKTPPPWVIDRQQFKTDYVGYLDRRRSHLYVLDLASETLQQLTHGDYDDTDAAWAPDGSHVAFVSNRTDNPDANYNSDIWVVSSDPEKAPESLRRVSDTPGPDSSPGWSPDAESIVHTSIVDAEAMLYATDHLALSPVDGSGTRVLTEALDRMIFNPAYAPDGKSIWFLLEDSGEQNLARIPAKGGRVERLIKGRDVVRNFDFASGNTVAALISRPQQPAEVFWFENGRLEQKTHINRELLAGLELGEVIEVSFNSKDGTPIEGFVIKPPGFVAGRRYPVILDIHGGPQAQYDYGFHFEAQLYAANGYLVVHPNPRGSTGYGQAFCRAIWLDWGGPDYEDVMAAVDHVIEQGWGDPDRMAVTGWSYGGMLTNHIITKTDRFKAAATGASATLYVVNYGHDMYQRWWEQELGLPWEPEARQNYERMSPFNRIDQVVTPTLILGGEIDWNVPIINSEQLYLALKRLGVETQLVVYPGEYHGIEAPSHVKDLYQRYLGWFDRYLDE